MRQSETAGILLVDAAAEDRRRLKTALETCGWRVWDAADGAEAVRVYADRRDEIGAVVVDLQLPGLQGARLLAELGGLDPALVRLATATGVSGSTAAAFRRLSPTPLFTKPVPVRELDQLLRASMPVAAGSWR